MSLKARAAACVVAACAGWFGAAEIIVPAIEYEEGTELVAYPDVGGVWTICNGETLGVRPGMVKTPEECRALTKSRAKYFYDVAQAAVSPPLTDLQAAGWTLFTYNVGLGGLKQSKALRLANSGQYEAGCRAMMNYHNAGWIIPKILRRDCRIRENGCYGLIVRRNREITACIGKENPWQSTG